MYKTAISQIQTLSVMSCLYHLDVTAELSRLLFIYTFPGVLFSRHDRLYLCEGQLY